MTSLGIPFPETEAGSFLRAECAGEGSSLPRIIVQCHLYSDFLGGPGVGVSAVFLIRTHGHAGHGHGVHVHLSHGTTAAVHVHHTVRRRAPLVGELLLGKRAVPGQVS